MKKYLIIIEKTNGGYSAYSPDLDGCIATGATREEVEKNMQDSIAFHLEGFREEDYEIPEPKSYSKYIKVPA